MSKENALLQEAINTALAFHKDTTVRGACYSCEKIGAFLRNSAFQAQRVVGQKTGQEARDALKRYVSTLDASHPLSRHVAGIKYKDPATDEGKIILPKTYRKNKSGKCGSETRRRQLERGDYEDGDDHHRRLKRGKRPEETVAAENARRPVKRASGRKRP
jgi:hypothetical protein